MSKNQQESWFDHLTRNKQELSDKSITQSALCLLKELDRDQRVDGTKDTSALAVRGHALQQQCPVEPEFGAFASAEDKDMGAGPCPVRS